LSLELTFRQLMEGRRLDLAEVFGMEFRLIVRCIHGAGSFCRPGVVSAEGAGATDFLEGVSAVLIKRRPPQWTFKSLADVSNNVVQAFFDPLVGCNELDLTMVDSMYPQV
jgi:Enoyl-CoA hydratase/isomerase